MAQTVAGRVSTSKQTKQILLRELSPSDVINLTLGQKQQNHPEARDPQIKKPANRKLKTVAVHVSVSAETPKSCNKSELSPSAIVNLTLEKKKNQQKYKDWPWCRQARDPKNINQNVKNYWWMRFRFKSGLGLSQIYPLLVLLT